LGSKRKQKRIKKEISKKKKKLSEKGEGGLGSEKKKKKPTGGQAFKKNQEEVFKIAEGKNGELGNLKPRNRRKEKAGPSQGFKGKMEKKGGRSEKILGKEPEKKKKGVRERRFTGPTARTLNSGGRGKNREKSIKGDLEGGQDAAREAKGGQRSC